MKRTLKIIVVAAFTVLGIALIPTIDTDAKLVSWDADASSSRALYVQNCARCHGADGKAQTALGKKLEADDISGGLSTSKVTRVVTSGRGEIHPSKSGSLRRRSLPSRGTCILSRRRPSAWRDSRAHQDGLIGGDYPNCDGGDSAQPAHPPPSLVGSVTETSVRHRTDRFTGLVPNRDNPVKNYDEL